MRSIARHGLKNDIPNYGQIKLTDTESTRKKLEEDELRSHYDPTFVFNPSMDDIYSAYDHFLRLDINYLDPH